MNYGGFDHHSRLPKDIRGNLELRQRVMKEAESSAATRATLIRACREDVSFFCNVFCFTFDPRPAQKVIPFVTWACQDRGFRKMAWCLDKGRDLVFSKSRDMGASWMNVVLFDWLFLFHPSTSTLMISRTAELVDGGAAEEGSSGSLFWKLDLIHRYLPRWMVPKSLVRKKYHLGNGDLGSAIDGTATTGAAGVGDRRTAVLIDEFSRIEAAKEVLAGTADVSECRLFNMTPWLPNLTARKLAHRSDVEKLELWWHEHPRKGAGLYRFDTSRQTLEILDKQYQFPPDYPFVLDGKMRSPEYDYQESRRGPREMSVMWDISWDASGSQFFDPQVIKAHAERFGRDPVWEGEVNCDGDNGTPFGLDRTTGGPLRMWVLPDGAGRLPADWYAVGCDISQGKGATNSCASIVSCTTGVKVAEYVTPYLPPEHFAAKVVALARLFSSPEGDGAKLAWEACGPGDTFGKKVAECGYWNVYYRRNPLARGGGKESDIPGWYPSRQARRTLLELYRAALGQMRMTNHSREALEECLSIHELPSGEVAHVAGEDEDEPDPSGAGVNHGDRVVADALSWMLAEPRLPGVDRKGTGDRELDPRSMAWRVANPDVPEVDRWADPTEILGGRV